MIVAAQPPVIEPVIPAAARSAPAVQTISSSPPATLPSNPPPAPLPRMTFPEPQVVLASTPPVPAVNRARELAQYVSESKPYIESTHVDRGVQERARAMLSPEEPAVFGAVDVHDEEADYSGRPVLPGVGAAMGVRVRFMGGEVPLWSLLAPVVIVASLSAALAAAAASHAPAQQSPDDVATPRASASVAADSAPSAQVSAERGVPTRAAESNTASSDGFDLPAGTYAAKDVLAIAEKRSAKELAAARALSASLDRDPASVQEPRTLSELRRFSENPDTAKVVLEAMAKLPAPLSADLLYEVWTGTPERNDVTELARALLFSKDVRPKASTALAVALDLRLAESCEKTSKVLPRAVKDADRRSLHLLLKLQRKYGCGPNKRLDCYPCLRGGDELEGAIKTAREHPEPRNFGKR